MAACLGYISQARETLEYRQADLEMEDETQGFLNWVEQHRKTNARLTGDGGSGTLPSPTRKRILSHTFKSFESNFFREKYFSIVALSLQSDRRNLSGAKPKEPSEIDWMAYRAVGGSKSATYCKHNGCPNGF